MCLALQTRCSGDRARSACGGALPTSAPSGAHSRRAAGPTEALDARPFGQLFHNQRLGRSLSQNGPIRFHLNSEPRQMYFPQLFGQKTA